MEINVLTYIFVFVFGANVGSFLNVLIDRLPRGEQVFSGRSYCERCKHKLSWPDLIPIFSWVFLRGRCRYCHSPISGYYPIVEVLTGILFVFVSIHLRGVSPPLAGSLHLEGVLSFLALPYYLFIISALIVIFFADLKYRIIPDQVVYSAIAVSLIFLISQPASPAGGYPNIPISHLFSSLGAGLFFLTLALVTRGRGMGLGDVKLVILMGLILGFPKIVVALYLSFLTGAFFGVILVLGGQKRFGQHIPFGPFLVTATIIAFWQGQTLWDYFGKLLGLA